MPSSLVELLDDLRQQAPKIFALFDETVPWVEPLYPPISLADFGLETMESALGDLEPDEIVATLQGYLLAAPRDVTVRWSVFAILYTLSGDPYGIYEDDEDGNEPFTHPDADRYLEELGDLVRSTTDPADLNDSKTLRWEVMNSCMVEDFSLADRLIDRLDAIEPQQRGKHSAIRGQLRFARWYADPREKEPFRWMAVLYPSRSQYALELARWALSASGEGPAGRVDQQHLDDAANWLIASLREAFDLPPQHRAVLARWFLDRGRPREAAEQYLAIIASSFCFEGQNEQHADELKTELYVATAHALSASGERTQAEQLLQRCTEEFPRFGGAWRLLAELHAEDTHYEQAFDCLNRWAEANPELETDAPTAIWVKTLRAIGSTKPSDRLRMVDEYFDAHPERLPFVEKAVTVHWSAFDSLDPESRRDWLRGCWMLWWSPPAWEWIDLAPVLFARATERALRASVFAPFVGESDRQVMNASVGQQGSKESQFFWRTLLKGGQISLGAMLKELMLARTTRWPISDRLSRWLVLRLPRLALEFSADDAERIRAARNPAAHASAEKLTREAAEDMCRACQKLLTLITAPSR